MYKINLNCCLNTVILNNLFTTINTDQLYQICIDHGKLNIDNVLKKSVK